MVGIFTQDPAVLRAGSVYLRIICFSFLASGVIFIASSLFQALGNTLPALLSSAARMALVIIPALLLSRRPEFQMTWVWMLSAATVWVQLGLSLGLLRREFSRRLGNAVPAALAPSV
jgi:Na+-driven multidrug efflux pump